MLPLLTMLWACSGGEAPAPEAPPPVQEPEPAPEPEPVEKPEARPPGKIGGEPILPDPVVIGAIHEDEVTRVIEEHRAAIDACFTEGQQGKPGLAGKVLFKILIGKDGAVVKATTHASSMRHMPTEDCMLEHLRAATFPPLQEGRLAVVHYPFAFPPP